jgi:hypothetical protein
MVEQAANARAARMHMRGGGRPGRCGLEGGTECRTGARTNKHVMSPPSRIEQGSNAQVDDLGRNQGSNSGLEFRLEFRTRIASTWL